MAGALNQYKGNCNKRMRSELFVLNKRGGEISQVKDLLLNHHYLKDDKVSLLQFALLISNFFSQLPVAPRFLSGICIVEDFFLSVTCRDSKNSSRRLSTKTASSVARTASVLPTMSLAVAVSLNFMACRSETSTSKPCPFNSVSASFLAAALNESLDSWANTISAVFISVADNRAEDYNEQQGQ